MINVSKLYCGLAGQSDQLRYGRRPDFGPVIVYNCTARCNLKCIHCYSASTSAKAPNEFSTQQAKTLLTQLKDINAAVALFSGGEPLMREDLFELLEEAKKMNLRSVLSTNGTLIDFDIANRLKDLSVAYIGISLDGLEPFHDQFRQTKGSFKAAMNGIRNCDKVGLRTGLRFTITKENLDQVPAVFDIAADNGIRRVCFYHLIRTGKAKGLDAQTPTAAQSRDCIEIILARTAEFVSKNILEEVLTVGNHCDGPFILTKLKQQGGSEYEKARELLLTAGGNKIGEKIGCVSWDGNVYADQFWRNYEKPLKEIWFDTGNPVLQKLRDKSSFADPRCKTCRFFNLCKGNYRFLDNDPDDQNWLNEPACYLTDDEIQ
ncbi:MAG: radical SAM protein [Planctomycetota bacterium]|jgi:radical SAM protein with 4Fe4S-binding SPASM domain